MAQGRRPDPFRTRKLRPGTAMVLHPEGCGRVARRRTKTLKGRGHHTCPLPFHIPRTHTRTRPDDHDRACRTREANPIPGHTTPAHRDNPPSHTPTMNRQVRHHTHDRHGIREPKIIALGDPFLRVCGGIHNPGGRHRGTTGPPEHPPARACPRIHNDALPAYRASRAPASGVRRMSRHTHLKKLLGPHGKPGCTPPAAGKDTGNTSDATTRPRPQHPRGSSAITPGSYMPQKHTKQTSHT